MSGFLVAEGGNPVALGDAHLVGGLLVGKGVQKRSLMFLLEGLQARFGADAGGAVPAHVGVPVGFLAFDHVVVEGVDHGGHQPAAALAALEPRQCLPALAVELLFSRLVVVLLVVHRYSPRCRSSCSRSRAKRSTPSCPNKSIMSISTQFSAILSPWTRQKSITRMATLRPLAGSPR